jgi:hypothetical protein
VAWIIVGGELAQNGMPLGPGALVYPESLVSAGDAPPPPNRNAPAITRSDVRALAIRADDFRELCEDDGDLGEALLESLAQVIAKRRARTAAPPVDPRGTTDPHIRPPVNRDVADARHPTDPHMRAVDEAAARERSAVVPAPPAERASTPSPRAAAPGDVRSPDDPQSEAYLELEAELPPGSGGDGVEPQRALDGEPDDEHKSVSITMEEGSTRVIETVTETSLQTLTVTVTEPPADEPGQPLTTQEGAAASGTIRDTPEPPRRARRHSES